MHIVDRKAANTSEADPIMMGRQWLELNSLRKRDKKKVDTKASKGSNLFISLCYVLSEDILFEAYAYFSQAGKFALKFTRNFLTLWHPMTEHTAPVMM